MVSVGKNKHTHIWYPKCCEEKQFSQILFNRHHRIKIPERKDINGVNLAISPTLILEKLSRPGIKRNNLRNAKQYSWD